MPEPVVRLENVFWKYARAEKPALDGVALEIGEGEFVAVMGENGAGKTTFCRLLNGLIPHSMPGRLLGSVKIDGTATADSTVARLSEKVGMAFDDPETQFFTATVFDEVAFALENMVLPPELIAEKTRRALNAAGLSDYSGRAPATLSGGQKQRLAIAAAVAMANRLLVLDEPCSQLDPAGTPEVLSFIRELRAGNRLTVVMATGSPEEAANFADRICVLKNGKLLAFDTPRRVFSNAELLAAAGIAPPEVCEFAFRMAALGRPLPRFPVTVEEAAESLPSVLDAVGGGGALNAGTLNADAANAGALNGRGNVRLGGEGRGPCAFRPPPLEKPVPGSRPAAPILIERLTYSYAVNPDRVVLDDVSLAIGENEFAAILGQNGSGKTTLIKNVVGLLRPVRGKIFIRGKDSGGMEVSRIAGEVGYVMQDSDNQLFEQTVYDEVAFALKLAKPSPPGGEVERKVTEALETLGLQDKRDVFPPALCKADRVKTVFAAVLAMGAGTLILDEPLAGQDLRGSATIMETLAGLHRKGYTIILVTHNVRVAARYAQRLIVMKSGRVCLDGNADLVFAEPEELAGAGILPPPVSGLSLKVRERLPPGKTAQSPAELADLLCAGVSLAPAKIDFPFETALQ